MAPSQSGIGWMLSSLWPTGSSHGSIRHHSSSTSAAITNNNEKPAAVRIGIVGGGIMGITVANSLIESLQKKNDPRLPNLQIIMLEGDHQGGGGMTEFNQNKHGPDWKAATARNANTIAVGASMHVLSTRPLVYSLLSNGIKDAIGSLQQQLFGQSNNTSAEASNKATKTNHSNPELFAKPPPFFAVKPYYCLGPPATWNERLAFVNFGLHFWYTALVHGGRTDAKARAQTLVQLAKATRHKFVQEIAPKHGCTSNWYAEGLLSVHRTEQAAQHALDECHEYGLPARKLSWDEAIQREPRLQRLPIDSLYAVLRPLDIAANCEQYTRLLLDKCQQYHNDDDDNDNGGVHFDYSSDRGKVTRIDYDANDDGSNGTYTIQQESGRSTQVDVVVLAAGAETPLLAQTLGVASQILTMMTFHHFWSTDMVLSMDMMSDDDDSDDDNDDSPHNEDEPYFYDDDGDDESTVQTETSLQDEITSTLNGIAMANMDKWKSEEMKLTPHTWFGDSAASTHMCNDDTNLYDYDVIREEIKVGSGKTIVATNIGKLKLRVKQTNGKVVMMVLTQVKFVPELWCNLFSLTAAMDKGFDLGNQGRIITVTHGPTTIGFDMDKDGRVGFRHQKWVCEAEGLYLSIK